jgi:hypothetical protein
VYVQPAAETGIPPIRATENHPSRVCKEPSTGETTWIAGWTETDIIRDCGAGSINVWYGANPQVQTVEVIVAAPTSAVKSKAKLSASPASIGSKAVATRIQNSLTSEWV